MSRPRKTFADQLDEWAEIAPAEDIHSAALHLNVWARVRRLGFRIDIKQAKGAATPLLDDFDSHKNLVERHK